MHADLVVFSAMLPDPIEDRVRAIEIVEPGACAFPDMRRCVGCDGERDLVQARVDRLDRAHGIAAVAVAGSRQDRAGRGGIAERAADGIRQGDGQRPCAMADAGPNVDDDRVIPR